jgi:hypothetical protein
MVLPAIPESLGLRAGGLKESVVGTVPLVAMARISLLFMSGTTAAVNRWLPLGDKLPVERGQTSQIFYLGQFRSRTIASARSTLIRAPRLSRSRSAETPGLGRRSGVVDILIARQSALYDCRTRSASGNCVFFPRASVGALPSLRRTQPLGSHARPWKSTRNLQL